MRVIVVGGGVAGLGSALALARAGHEVTVLERDDTPMPTSADEAFAWDRRGAPQVRQSHAFLARLTNLLRDHYPDVLAELLAAGATEIRFGEGLPPTMVGFVPEPEDADLTMIACRRTTFEWIVRRAALAEGNVSVRTGIAVNGLLTADAVVPGIPHVAGVHCADGTAIDAELVIMAAGRRSVASEWLTAIGARPVAETAEDTGIVYQTRFYRLLPGQDVPPRGGPIGGDLGYLKYGVFAGDCRTFSVTLATPVADDELRRRFSVPVVFDAAARELAVAAPWLDGRAEPITPKVHMMAGLLNRWCDFMNDGTPVATGFLAVGDALLCTNPLYGRGCSTAFWGAQLIVEAIDAHEGDPLALAMAYDASVRRQLFPWYRATVLQDAEARRVAAALLAGENPDDDEEDPRTFMRAVLRDGLLPALRTDPTVLRAFMRNFNLLTPPDALRTDPDVSARVLAVWSDRENHPAAPLLGPANRDELLARIAA